MQTMVTELRELVSAENVGSENRLTHLGHSWWRVGRSEVGSYDGVGDDMNDGRIEGASQDRVLLSTKQRRWFRLSC